jgi:hypothetical protein
MKRRSCIARTIRTGSDHDFLVVHLRDFCSDDLPHARIGNNSGTVIEQAPDESFEIFQARAIAAAKAAGDSWGVAITVPRLTDPRSL